MICELLVVKLSTNLYKACTSRHFGVNVCETYILIILVEVTLGLVHNLYTCKFDVELLSQTTFSIFKEYE